jgi:hypothetical protein
MGKTLYVFFFRFFPRFCTPNKELDQSYEQSLCIFAMHSPDHLTLLLPELPESDCIPAPASTSPSSSSSMTASITADADGFDVIGLTPEGSITLTEGSKEVPNPAGFGGGGAKIVDALGSADAAEGPLDTATGLISMEFRMARVVAVVTMLLTTQ